MSQITCNVDWSGYSRVIFMFHEFRDTRNNGYIFSINKSLKKLNRNNKPVTINLENEKKNVL